MLKSIYTSITDQSFIICSLASLLLGLFSCIVYSRSHRARKDFTAVLFLMPFIICVVLLVANSLTSSFLIVSIFALTRFRTVQYKAEEIMSVFASVVLGLLCATGYVYVAILFTALYSFLLLLYNRISIRTHQMLKVTIPENVSFSALNEPLEKHTDYYKLVDYKTTNLGSLYKLTYDVIIKKGINPQDMIDSIRILNGNLEVEVSEFVEVKDWEVFMKNYIKKLLIFSIVFTLFGCSAQKKDEQVITPEQDISDSSSSQDAIEETTPIFTFEDDILLEGTITEQVYVDSDNDVTITLRNVTADMSQTVINVNSAKSTTIILEGENTFNVSSVEVKAIDSRDDLIIKGSGSLTINSTDTAIKSNDDLTVKSGTLILNSTEGDGIRANEKLVIDGGTISINSSEGLEATEIEINDGVIEVNATDDGINASNKSSKGLTPTITINGGELTVNMKQGDTDAIDSNGYIYINGGVTNINAQFAFDFVSGAEFNGGEVYINGQQVSQIDNSMAGNPGGGMMPPQGVGQLSPDNSSGQGFAPNGNFGPIPPENQTEGEKPRRGN